MAYFVVLRRAGPEWDRSRPLEEQSGWAEHAAFMDGLVDAGFVVLGGPLADGHRMVLAVEANSEDTVRATLARDRWSGSHLLVESVDGWTIRLDGRRSSAPRAVPTRSRSSTRLSSSPARARYGSTSPRPRSTRSTWRSPAGCSTRSA